MEMSKKKKLIKYKGNLLSVAELACVLNVNTSTIYRRLRKSKNIITKEVIAYKKRASLITVIDKQGNHLTLSDVADIGNLTYKDVYRRYSAGKKYRDIKSLTAPLFSL